MSNIKCYLHNELSVTTVFLQIYLNVISVSAIELKIGTKNALFFSGPTQKLMRLTFPKSKTLAGG